MSAAVLRREIHARQQGRFPSFEQSFGRGASVVYAADDEGGHGNFLRASYRRICADAAWRERLEKAYTAANWLPRAGDRRRGELECASSSDALLMNVFCYPRLLQRADLCRLLGIETGLRPAFGVRAQLAMRGDEIDRTELDMVLGDLAVEAKLTETSLGTAARERVFRYTGLDEAFEVEELPWGSRGLNGYQVVRGALAIQQRGGRYLLLYDDRRGDLAEIWFRVLRAVRSSELRSRMVLLSWQELASVLPATVRSFLAEKYGIAMS